MVLKCMLSRHHQIYILTSQQLLDSRTLFTFTDSLLLSHPVLIQMSGKEILAFQADTDTAPGHDSFSEASVKTWLSRKAGVNVADTTLGRPAVRNGLILVGTDSPTSERHYLCCLSKENMNRLRADPMMSYSVVLEQIRDIRWLNDTIAVCATGKGTMQLFDIAVESGIKHVKTINDVHADCVRELAVQVGQSGLVASGGFDGTLCIFSFQDAQSVSVMNKASLADKVIGSVKWPSFNSNVCVSCTTDDGCYAMLDTRSDMKAAAVMADTGKVDLFTHARYTDHHVLLGYGDGEIRQLDMRKPGEMLLSVHDPYVEGIGGIEFNSTGQAFVVSGFTDCSVWRIQPSGQASIWSHELSGELRRINQNGYSVTGVFADDDTVVTADTESTVRLCIQGMSHAN